MDQTSTWPGWAAFGFADVHDIVGPGEGYVGGLSYPGALARMSVLTPGGAAAFGMFNPIVGLAGWATRRFGGVRSRSFQAAYRALGAGFIDIHSMGKATKASTPMGTYRYLQSAGLNPENILRGGWASRISDMPFTVTQTTLPWKGKGTGISMPGRAAGSVNVLQANRLYMKAVPHSLRRDGLKATASRFGAARTAAALGMRAVPFVGWGLLAYDFARASRFAFHKMGEFYRARHQRMTADPRESLLDSEGAATERRRSLQVISQSRMNARSAFGWEAKRFHSV